MENEIGTAAGKVWDILSKKGPLSKSQVVKFSGLSNSMVDHAIGWLAREGKMSQVDTPRGKALSVKK